jgi:hypothetical protein
MFFLAFFLGVVGMLLLMLAIASYRCEYRGNGWTINELKTVVRIALFIWIGINAFIYIAGWLVGMATPQ